MLIKVEYPHRTSGCHTMQCRRSVYPLYTHRHLCIPWPSFTNSAHFHSRKPLAPTIHSLWGGRQPMKLLCPSPLWELDSSFSVTRIENELEQINTNADALRHYVPASRTSVQSVRMTTVIDSVSWASASLSSSNHLCLAARMSQLLN